MKWVLCAAFLCAPMHLHADEAAPTPVASRNDELREHIRELEVQVDTFKMMLRLRSGELLVARGQLRALERRPKGR